MPASIDGEVECWDVYNERIRMIQAAQRKMHKLVCKKVNVPVSAFIVSQLLSHPFILAYFLLSEIFLQKQRRSI